VYEPDTALSGPLADLGEGMVDGTPEVYAEIQERFAGREAVSEAARELADADRKTFVERYEEAGKRR
jgi:prephenate dehydrogenase